MVNCAFPTCTVSRNTKKYDGISLFKSEKVNTTTWRKHLLDVLSKYREMSSMFKKEVMECQRELFICEMHYAEDDIEYTKTGIKTPCLQALPTMNWPLKSHEDTKVGRKLLAFRIVTTETDDVEGKEVFVYKDLDELHKRVQKCNWITEKWYTTYENNAVKLTFNIEPHSAIS